MGIFYPPKGEKKGAVFSLFSKISLRSRILSTTGTPAAQILRFPQDMKGFARKTFRGSAVLLAVLLLFVSAPRPSAAQETLREGELVDLERCLKIALSRHPSLQAAAQAVKAGESRVGQAKAAYFPQVTWSTSASRTDPYTTPVGAEAAKGGEITNQYLSSLNLSQTLYDFQKTARQVRIQDLGVLSARGDLDMTRLSVTLGVRKAYYDLLKARRQREVAAETVEQFQRHLEQAQAFFRAGTKPKIDVTKGEVDLGNARLNLVKAQNALSLAVAALNNAMGYPGAPPFVVADDPSEPGPLTAFEEALEKAYKNRPDLKAAVAKRQSAEESVRLAKTGYFPSLTGSAGVGYGGQQFPVDRGWTVGATLSVPIFSGLSTRYQVEEALANLQAARANEENLRQAIHLEVRQAWLNWTEAKERLSTAMLTVRQAEENRDLATGRYEAGVGSAIEVTDAIVAFNNAKMDYLGALYDLKTAQATMEKAMGL